MKATDILFETYTTPYGNVVAPIGKLKKSNVKVLVAHALSRLSARECDAKI